MENTVTKGPSISSCSGGSSSRLDSSGKTMCWGHTAIILGSTAAIPTMACLTWPTGMTNQVRKYLSGLCPMKESSGEKLLTGSDGQYAEIQSGRLFNQNVPENSLTPCKHFSFSPFQTDGWTEYWYPFANTRGVVHAGPNKGFESLLQSITGRMDERMF